MIIAWKNESRFCKENSTAKMSTARAQPLMIHSVSPHVHPTLYAPAMNLVRYVPPNFIVDCSFLFKALWVKGVSEKNKNKGFPRRPTFTSLALILGRPLLDSAREYRSAPRVDSKQRILSTRPRWHTPGLSFYLYKHRFTRTPTPPVALR